MRIFSGLFAILGMMSAPIVGLFGLVSLNSDDFNFLHGISVTLFAVLLVITGVTIIRQKRFSVLCYALEWASGGGAVLGAHYFRVASNVDYFQAGAILLVPHSLALLFQFAGSLLKPK